MKDLLVSNRKTKEIFNMEQIITEIMKQFELNESKIFSIDEFYYLGSKNTVKSVFSNLEKNNEIHKVLNGLYVKPYYSEFLQEYSYPTPDEVARKIADKFSWKICEGSDKVLNLLGLSTQVPNKYIYISDGPYRKYDYRGREIVFKHTNIDGIFSYSREFALMVVAIRAIGKSKFTDVHLYKLTRYAKYYIKENFDENTIKLPFWIKKVIAEIKDSNEEKWEELRKKILSRKS